MPGQDKMGQEACHAEEDAFIHQIASAHGPEPDPATTYQPVRWQKASGEESQQL